MKPISVHVSEADYAELKALARERRRPAAQLLREAMQQYLLRERERTLSVLDLPVHPGGKEREGWTREEIWDEMIGEPAGLGSREP